MNAPASPHIEPLNPSRHDRKGFDCGVEPLNRYLSEQAALDMKRRTSGCWVMVDPSHPSIILGYYTLSAESVLAHELEAADPAFRKKLPRYPRFVATLIGRLAVSKTHQGSGLGGLLLTDALLRCVQLEVPAVVVLVDPKDEPACRFYTKHGFQPLTPTRMFLPTSTVAVALDGQ